MAYTSVLLSATATLFLRKGCGGWQTLCISHEGGAAWIGNACLLAPHILHFHKKAKNWTYNRIWREIYKLNKNLRWRILREKCKNGHLAPSKIKTGNRKTEAQSAVNSEPTSCGHYRVLHKQRRSNSNCCGVWFIPLIKYLSIRVLFYLFIFSQENHLV